jgi:hypothetical protein
VKLRGHGIGAQLPRGWEGTIRAERREDAQAQVGSFAVRPQDRGGDAPERPSDEGPPAAPVTAPVAHFATFPLPARRDDFGGDLVELMSDDDVFVALLEYGPAEAGTALFSDQGLPRRLDPRRFSPGALQRTRTGSVGYQRFFTEAGRPFCLYVVIRSEDVHRHVRRVEELLATVEIESR